MSRYNDLRNYLMDISCSVGSLEAIKADYSTKVASTRRLESIYRLRDLIILLEKRDHINEDNVDILEELYLQFRDVSPPQFRRAQGIFEVRNKTVPNLRAVLLYFFDEIACRLCYVLEVFFSKVSQFYQRYDHYQFYIDNVEDPVYRRVRDLRRNREENIKRFRVNDILFLILFLIIISSKCCLSLMKIIYELLYPYLYVFGKFLRDKYNLSVSQARDHVDHLLEEV